MSKLIKAELKKIFKKKSFYVVSIIFILYTILTNAIYKNIDNYDLDREKVDIEEYIEINNNLDLTKKEDLEEYIANLTLIEVERMKEEYKNNTQIYLIDNYIYDLVYTANKTKYILNDETEYIKIKEEISKYKELIINNDWKYFANIKLEELKDNLLKINDIKEKERYRELIFLVDYRIENNIAYDENNYINNAIESLEIDSFEYYNLLKKDNLTKMEKERLTYLKENYLRNKYILENKKDINNGETLQSVLSNFPSEFGLFILIYIVMISGSIVSEEYNKGTIKYLLTKPCKRSKILTSKLITSIILIPIIILFMVLIELIIGGIILGFNSLNVPILIYNSITNSLVNYNIFAYLGVLLVSYLPMYLILNILCFTLSVISLSTSAAITITFLFYLVGNIISNIALIYDLKILKFFVSLHWDYSYLIKLIDNPYNTKLLTSITVLIIYIIIMLCTSYIYFSKKDVKNI